MINILKGKVILLNSPPSSGKDFAAKDISKRFGAKHVQFKEPLFKIAKALTGLTDQEFFSIYNDRNKKEHPQKEFHGLSPRGLMIWIAESICKPKFGSRFFGDIAAKSLDFEKGTVFSDSGFPEEVYPIADRVGSENVYIIRSNRNGASFDGDRRKYLEEGTCPIGVNFIDLNNNGEAIEPFVDNIIKIIQMIDGKGGL